jgi:antitoxin VapB
MPRSSRGEKGGQASVFQDGRNKAVRIPREYEFEEEIVWITREGKRLVLEPVPKSESLLAALEKMQPI